MKIEKFEDLIAWQKARALTIEIYKKFSDHKDYTYKNQIQRASVSIMNTISEGFDRNTKKEFKNFLYIAKGSCSEIRSMLYLGKDLKYFSEKEYNMLYELVDEVSKILYGLIKSIKTD